MLDLALHFGERPVLVKDISRRQGISQGYLEQLFITLRSAGLVKSTRGASGGFRLVRSPAEIRLSEIIQATEGSTAPAACVEEGSLCKQSQQCITRDVWLRITRACDKVLDSMSLQDLVERHGEKCSKFTEGS